MRIRTLHIFAAAAFMILATGCASTGTMRFNSADEAFNRGMALYERGRYERAAEAFQRALEFSRTGEWADDAQLYLARSYAGNKEYILAASEFSRFSEIYRNDPRREQAEYERALAYYEMSPGYELDQSNTERAIRQFAAFMERFPNSTFVPQAEARVNELREKMAQKRYESAKLYERRGIWEAAAISYVDVFDTYPDTEWADDALVGAMAAYIEFSDLSIRQRQAERLEKALENYRRLVQVFPDSPLLGEAERLNQEATSRLERIDALAEN